MITAIGIYLVLSAILRIYFRILDSRADRDLIENGEKTLGKVVDRVTYPQEDSLQSSQYRLIAEYRDSRGDCHFVKSKGQMCGAYSREYIGSEMEIIYDRADPSRSRFSCDEPVRVSFWVIFGNALSALVGAVLILAEVMDGSQ